MQRLPRLSTLLALLVALLAAVPTAHATTATERAVVRLVNATRAEHGLPPLVLSTPVHRAARGHSTDMGRRDYFSHRTLGSGAGALQRVRHQRPGRLRWVGETIGWGSGSLGSARGVVAAWMASPAHRRTLLDRRFRRIGVGAWRGTFSGHAGATVYTANLAG